MSYCRKFLAVMALAGASCADVPDSHRYEAEYSAWAMELAWTHRWTLPTEAPDAKTGRYRIEMLKLVFRPNRVGEDLKIDGEAVIGTFVHGGEDWCLKAHRVAGTVRLLEHGATQARARVDAVMDCPGTPPAALKGEFAFDVKIPP